MITLKFAWYDLWIGAYIDRPNRTLYVCPLPCILVTVRRRSDGSPTVTTEELPS